MSENSFLEEISGYSIDELTLIFKSQKDLYSVEEMDIIKKRIQELTENEANKQKEFIEKNFPKRLSAQNVMG